MKNIRPWMSSVMTGLKWRAHKFRSFRIYAERKDGFPMRFLENRTQSEIAEKLDVSQMTVSRLEKGIKQEIFE